MIYQRSLVSAKYNGYYLLDTNKNSNIKSSTEPGVYKYFDTMTINEKKKKEAISKL